MAIVGVNGVACFGVIFRGQLGAILLYSLARRFLLMKLFVIPPLDASSDRVKPAFSQSGTSCEVSAEFLSFAVNKRRWMKSCLINSFLGVSATHFQLHDLYSI
jgi:hypothetical protein